MKTILTTVAILGIAGPALAEGCNWGHAKMDAYASVEAPAISTPQEIVVATVDCSALTGEAKTACLASAE